MPRPHAHCLLLLAAMTGGTFWHTSAFAATMVQARLDSVSPARDAQITFVNTRRNPSATATTSTIRTGRLNWTGTAASNPTFNQGAFSTFCVDFIQGVGIGTTYNFHAEPLSVAPRPNAPGSGNPVNGSGANLGLGTNRTQEVLLRQLFAAFHHTLGTDADRNAAFQLTIWEILNETDTTNASTLTAGNFRVSGGSNSGTFVPIADQFIGFLVDPVNANAPQDMGVVALTHGVNQDQIGYIPEAGPAALGLMTPALLLLRRHRRA